MPDIETHGTVGDRPLCEFTSDPPREWDDDHARVDATKEENHRHVTCNGCKPKLKGALTKAPKIETGLEVTEG